MQHTFIYNDKSYDLRKKLIPVMQKLNNVIEIDNSICSEEEKSKSILDFICEVIEKKSVIDIFGTDDLNEIDLSELAIIFLMIKDAYDEPINEYHAKKQSQVLNNDFIEKISKLTSTIEGFNKAVPKK